MVMGSEQRTDANPIAPDGMTVPIRLKLSALWASVMFCYIYADYFSLWQPGTLHGMADGQGLLATQGALLGASVLMAVPSVMVFLPLVLPTHVNRWVNIVLGAVYTLVIIAGMIIAVMRGAWVFYIFFNVIEVALTLTVVVLAWRRSR